MPTAIAKPAISKRKPRTASTLPKPHRAPCVPFAAVWDKVRRQAPRAVCIGTYANKQSAWNTVSAIRRRHRDTLVRDRIDVWVKGTQVYARADA